MSRRTSLPPWVRLVRERATPEQRSALAHLDSTQIRSPRDAYTFLAPRLELEEVEVFVVLALNGRFNVIGQIEVTRGIVNSSLVHPREVFRIAIALGATAVIVAHNHPSGDPTPSPDDRKVTEQLVAAGRLLDMPVQDHVVVGAGRYVSFAEAGLL